MPEFRATYASKKEGENYQFSELIRALYLEDAIRDAKAKARKNNWTLVSVHEEQYVPAPQVVYEERPNRWPYRECRPPIIMRGWKV